MRNKILKFRAWDGLNKKFTYWTMNDLCTWAEKDEKPSPLDDWQQDTGLLDKNGKKIYESDVIKTHWQHDGMNNYDYEITGEIIWDDYYSAFRIKNKEYNFPLYSFEREQFCDKDGDNEIEIIGNIYENPDLLKK